MAQRRGASSKTGPGPNTVKDAMKWLLLSVLLPMVAAGCPDHKGPWFAAHETGGYMLTLVVDEQTGCNFHGVVSVTGSDSNSEHRNELTAESLVQGTIHGDGFEVTVSSSAGFPTLGHGAVEMTQGKRSLQLSVNAEM